MTRTVVHVNGLRELDRALAELPKATSKAVMRRVMLKAAQPMYETAKALAPVRADASHKVYFGPKAARKERRVGTAKALVQVGTRLTKRQARAARKLGKAEVEVYVGSRDPISRLLEFGTAEMPAQPIFRPAWDAHKFGVIEDVEADLAAEITRAAARVAKKRLKLGN